MSAGRPSEPIPPSPKGIAAQPGPREVKGLIAPWLGLIFKWPYRAALAGVLRLPVGGDQLTILSVALNVWIAVMLADGSRFLPGVLLIPAGLLDIFDGGVARARGTAGPRGAWFDSVCDRGADAAVLGGLYLSLARQGEDVLAALALASLLVSLVVSYVRAQAQALGAPLGEGLFARLERYVALIAGLIFPGALLWSLLALAGLGGVTLVQRIVGARPALRAPRAPG